MTKEQAQLILANHSEYTFAEIRQAINVLGGLAFRR